MGDGGDSVVSVASKRCVRHADAMKIVDGKGGISCPYICQLSSGKKSSEIIGDLFSEVLYSKLRPGND